MKKYGLLAATLVLFGVGCSGSNSPETKNDTPQAEAPKADGSKPADAKAASGDVKFADVQTIFTMNCVKCHSGTAAKAGLDLTSYEGAMKGTSEGPIVQAGDPAKSKIIMALKGNGAKQMPMMAEPLAAADIEKVEAWIKAGAKKD